MTSSDSDSFTSSIPIWMPFLSFSWLTAMTNRIYSTMLSKSGKSGHLCLAPDLRGNIFSFSPLRMNLALGLLYMAFTMLRYVPSIPTLLQFLSWMNEKFCWMLSMHLHMILWYLSFILLMWCVILVDSWIWIIFAFLEESSKNKDILYKHNIVTIF